MRRISLLFTLAAFSILSFGQVQKNEIKSKPGIADKTIQSSVQSPSNTGKTPGEVFWSEDFDSARWAASVDTATNLLADTALMPEGWTVYDATGNDFYWHWSLKGPRGRYTSYDGNDLMSSLQPSTDPIDWLQSATNYNGVMMLESDFFNTAPDGNMVASPIDMNSYIMTPAINIAGRPGVCIRFTEYFRYCCTSSATLSIFVSGDYDPANPDVAHWTEYDAKMGQLVSGYKNPRFFDTNISVACEGYDQIYIKWLQDGASHYIWQIDDVELYEPYQNNLVLKNTWADYMYLPAAGEFNPQYYSGGYTFIPKDLTSEFVQFRGAVNNFGMNTQSSVTMNVKVVKNGIDESPVYDHNSPAISLASAITDTCFINDDFTPYGIGNYAIKYKVNSENNDEFPEDNMDEINFKISDTLYSRNSMDPANFRTVSPGNWYAGNVEGSQLGLLYDIPFTTTISSLTTWISYRNDSALVAGGNFKVIGHVIWVDAEGNYVPFAQTEQYTLNPEDRGKFLTLPFRDDGNLIIEEGTYYVTLEFFTNTPNGSNHVNFYIGEDLTVPFSTQSNGYAVCPLFNGDWGWVIANPVITLNIESGPTPMATCAFNINMQEAIDHGIFDPATDSVYIIGSFNDFTYELMENTSGTIYSRTESIPIGDFIKFTFSINKVYNYLTLTTTINNSGSQNYYWVIHFNVLNPELAKIKIGPNPVSNKLHISNLDKVSKVEICNIIGEVIYTKNNPSQILEINTSKFSKGIYMISFTAKDNTKRTDRLVKE